MANNQKGGVHASTKLTFNPDHSVGAGQDQESGLLKSNRDITEASAGGRLPLDKIYRGHTDITMTAAPKSVPRGCATKSGRAANAVSTLDVASPYY
jgi:hypothetical protein